MTQHEPGLASGGQLPSGRIDVHAHYVPAELQASVPAAPIFRGFATWQPQAALEMMDRQGIATAILSMVMWTAMFAAEDNAAAARRVARSSNEAAAEAIRSHPDRFGGFARLGVSLKLLSPGTRDCVEPAQRKAGQLADRPRQRRAARISASATLLANRV